MDPCEALTTRFNCVYNKGSVVLCLRYSPLEACESRVGAVVYYVYEYSSCPKSSKVRCRGSVDTFLLKTTLRFINISS